MKNKVRKVLYISNIKVPYRVRFLNELAKEYDLTVLYERKKSLNRNENWASSEAINYHVDYLGGKPFKNEHGLSTRILSIVLKGWDAIIIGCYNSPSQILAMQLMRMRHIPYIINLDGEQFIGNGLKDKIKRVILHGASGYLVAGEKSGETLANALGLSEDLVNVKITPYYFSSLSEQEIEVHSKERCIRNNKVLVIGQYFDYKGMDVAYEVAKRTPYISYKFIGMGNRTSLFLKERTGGGHKLSNVEIIPFLQKQELAEEYKQCGCLLLPSRQECWGLVVNEAASFGTPIVSTWGSGAAVEFLSDEYPQYLAKPGDSESLLNCLRLCLNSDNSQYSQYLMEKSKNYSIERSVDCHRKAIEMLTR